MAVPADDSCATIGCMVSLRFSTNIFQLQSCMIAQHAAGDLEPAFGRAVDHVVDRSQRLAEVFPEPRPRRSKTRKHETSIVGRRDLAESVGDATRRARLPRNRRAGARCASSRPVGRSSRDKGSACTTLTSSMHGAHNLRAPMRTTVMQHPYHVVRAAQQDHRLSCDLGGVVVTRRRHLAVVADIDPGVAPQALHLQVEQLRVEVEVAMDRIRPHQRADGLQIVAIAVHATFSNARDNAIP